MLGLVALLAAGDRAARLRARLLVRPGDVLDAAADLDPAARPSNTALYSGAAAALATVAAVPIALLVERHRSRDDASRWSARPTSSRRCPGSWSRCRSSTSRSGIVPNLYLSSFELIVAYAIMFFPLALVAVRAGIAQAPPGLEEVARSLGHGRLSVLARITLPIIAPALIAGFSLVFISASTELTATLILHPTGVNTLATGFWAFTSDFSYGAAAPYALALLLVALLPGPAARPLVRADRGRAS